MFSEVVEISSTSENTSDITSQFYYAAHAIIHTNLYTGSEPENAMKPYPWDSTYLHDLSLEFYTSSTMSCGGVWSPDLAGYPWRYQAIL